MSRIELHTNPFRLRIVLSRRNLLALLHKLDMPDSQRTIGGRYLYVDGKLTPPNVAYELVCEDDAQHYIAREPPGEMHPDTEAFIQGEKNA